MTARTNRTVRIVAGSSAAALVMCTVSLVGTANAVVSDQAGTTGIRPVPTQNPNATTGFQNAPFVTTSAQGAKVNDFQVTIGNQWKTGDALAVVLPAGVTFAGTPTVTVEGPTTQQSIRENARTQVIAPQNAVRNPTVTAALDTAPAANGGVVRVTFTNDSSQTPTPALRFVLNFTGVSVNTSTNAAQGALTARVFGIDRTLTGNPAITPNAPALATTTLAFITNLAIGVTSPPVIPGGGAQTIGNITLAEKTPEALVDGTYTFTFTTGPVGNTTAVPVLDPDPAGGAFDVKVSGDAALAQGAATATGNTLSLPLTSLNAGGALEAFAVSGVRLNPPAGSGPIRVTLTSINGGPVASNTQFTFNAVNTPNANDQNDGSNNGAGQQTAESRVPNKIGIDTGSIGVLPQDQRIGGNDRYQTAAQIAAQLSTGRSIDTIVIASGEQRSNGVDALSANYLAGALADGATGNPATNANGNPVPVLLTQQGKLTDVTRVAIQNLFAARQTTNVQAKIYVVGGESAVSAAAFAEIQLAAATAVQSSQNQPNLNNGSSVQRVGGNDRFATAANTATVLGEAAVGTYKANFSAGAGNTVFLSNGLTPADALSAGPIAYRNNFPVLLTQQGSIPKATSDAMDSDNVKNVILLGGTTAVSDSVVTQLQGLGYNVIRVAGADRFGTNTALRAFATNTVGGTSNNPRGGLGYPAPTTPLLANGLGFADALTAGPLAAEGTRNGAAQAIDINQPLLLTSPAALSPATAAYLSGNRATITKVTGVGLGAALPQSVLIAANNAAQSN